MVKKLLILFFISGFIVACEEILEVIDISQEQVELLAPLDQSQVNSSIVNFNWNGVDQANAYLIQVATPNFENASQLVLDSIMEVDSTFVGTRISKKLSNGSYQWRIKALNSDFQTAFSTNGFTVEATAD